MRVSSVIRRVSAAALAFAVTACATTDGRNPLLSRLPDTNPATNTGERIEATGTTIQDASGGERVEETVRYGDGQTLRRGRLQADPLPGGAYTVNFADARVDEAAQTIFGDLLDQPYLIDPRVQGRVTMNTPRPLSREGLLALFEASLSVNNAALVATDGVYRVMPAGEAQTSGLAAFSTTAQPGWGVTAIPLEYVSANQIRTLMESVVTRPGALRADPARNLLLILGSAPERRNAAAAAQAFDVDWLAGMSIAIVPLLNANGADVIEEINALYNPGGEANNSALRLQHVERLNAILAIAPSRALLDQTRQWIADLDIGGADGALLRTYSLENGEAEATAELLNTLLSDGNLGGVAPDLDSGTASSSGGSNVAGGRQIRVIADTLNNAILVLADPAGQALVERALRTIDQPASMVIIEAVIAEVTLNDTLRYGVQFFFNGDGVDGLGESTRGGFSTDGFDANGVFPGFNLLLENGEDARVALDALSSVTDLTVVSSPTVMVLDNQTANFQVGDEVPIVTRQSNSVVNPDSPVVNSVEFRDTGVLLTVTPRVSSTGMVRMEISQEVSNVTGSSNSLTPTIATRSLDTVVAVRSGQTVILGGLIDESRTGGRDGLPGINRVPVLGDLLSQTNVSTTRTELLIFLTPRVINTDEEAAAVTNEIRQRMELLRPYTD